jgi:hypothetical protein
MDWIIERARDPERMYYPNMLVMGEEVFRTNARLSETFDQIAIVYRDERLPSPEENATAGATPDGYDYGVFNFVDLFAQALHGKDSGELTQAERKGLFAKFEHDLSDHMPVWIRLAVPG